MILIEIDKNFDTYTLYDTSNDNEWEYEGKYRSHRIDGNGVLHVQFDENKVELPAGCCILTFK